jgi:hypothetical protein
MQQVAPHTWTFQPTEVAVAPMKAHCRSCRTTVAILNPSALDLKTGNYVVRGQCEHCLGEVLLIIS